VTLSINSSTL
ncbi:NAD binding domain of 6-phosphogluconate dehydrogenase family protein, partial [Vibrio parahaemolyticus AQ3810]